MPQDQEVGNVPIRSQFFDKVLKQTVMRKYKFKQALSIQTTSAWNNFFYRQSQAVLDAASGNPIKSLPRGANFPQATVQYERINALVQKYGLEDNLNWEDIISNDIDVQTRTIVKIGEGIVKAVDDEIFNVLTTDVDRQTLSITAGKYWTAQGVGAGLSAAIIADLMEAKRLIIDADYDVDNLMVFLNPRDHSALTDYLTSKGAQFPKIAENLVSGNGNVGSMLGFNFIVSRSVTASEALVVIPKMVGTWRQLVPLQTNTKVDEFKSVRVRAVEVGITQVFEPKAIVHITGTQLNQAG